MKKPSYCTISFYKFINFSQNDLLDLKQSLEIITESLHTRGLILIGREGVNATVSGRKSAINRLKSFFNTFINARIGKNNDLLYKENPCHFLPFKRMKVKIREEIIKMRPVDSADTLKNSMYLSPKQWHQSLKKAEGLFLDVRNWYETQLGTFHSAQVLNIKTFAQFADAFKKLNVPKDQPIYTFCTGGIRCEKACVEMQKIGYSHTYQLKGGILNYLQEYANSNDHQWQDHQWRGECFVFDHRVAVDTSLQPSRIYALCPHCGQPASQSLDCKICGQSTKICKSCLAAHRSQTCSKNCTYHYQNKDKRNAQILAKS